MRKLWLGITSSVLIGLAVSAGFAMAQITPAQLWSQFGAWVQLTNKNQGIRVGTTNQFSVDNGGNATTSNLVITGTCTGCGTGFVPTSRTINTTAPLQGGGNLSANLTLSIPQASTTGSGYLSSTDWNAFNLKQPAGNYITALTGDLTASGPGSVVGTLATVNSNAGTFGNASTSAVITVNGKGLVTAVSTSSIYSAFSASSPLNFNNSTGAFSFTGILAVANGGTGSSSLNTTLVPEGNNLYFTNARAQNAISLTTTGSSGVATYIGGVLNIPNYAGGGGGSGGGWATGTPSQITNSFGNVVGINSNTPSSNLVVQGVSASSTLPVLTVASSTNAILFQVLPNGSTTIASLGTGNVRSSGGSLFNGAIDLSGADATGILAAARFPALTGDITTSAGALATTLATVNGNVGTFGSTSQIPQFTVNGKGLITAASNNTPSLPASDITSGILAVNIGGTGTTSLGSLTLGSNLSFTIGDGKNVLIGTSTQISLGGNIVTSLATGTSGSIFNGSISGNALTLNLPFASGVNTGQLQASDFTNFTNKQATISVTAPITLTGASVGIVNQGTTTQVLHGNAAGNASFSQIVNGDITNSTIDLTTKVTGILPVVNGGTGTTTKGNLTLTSANLTFGSGDGIGVLLGTSTNITLSGNPAFSGLTVAVGATSLAALTASGQTTLANASTTNLSVATNLYLNNISGTQCLHSIAGLVSGTGSDCGGGTNYWTTTTNGIYNNSGYLVGVNTSTPTANLFVQASSTAPTIPYFALASTSGTSVLTVVNSLFPQVNVGTTTVQNIANLYVRGTSASSTADLFRLASSTGTTLFQVSPVNSTGGAGKVYINPQNPGDVSSTAALEVDGLNGNLSDFIFKVVSNTTAGFPTIGLANASGTPTSVTNLTTANSELASFDGYTWVPTSLWKRTASISYYVDGTLSTSSAPSQIRFYTTASGSVTPTQRMVINNDGNVGIGTTTPVALLSIKGTSGSTTPLFIVASSTNVSLFNISPNGRVGIASSSPNYGFVNNGTAALPGLTTSASTFAGYLCISAQSEVINDTGTGCVVSAKRFKNNFGTGDYGLNLFLNLPAVSYYYKTDYLGGDINNRNLNGKQEGVFADDVAVLAPELATYQNSTSTYDGASPGTVEGLQDFSHWLGPITKAFQDLNSKIGKAKRSAEENWQWAIIGILLFGWVINRRKINKLEKILKEKK